ncbi:secondary thiamine-phosphate synthase enzyme YjbQ [Thermosphaera sp.]|uniref:YjbQ family protein n=1 Tax=Thermosphaera aggregans TaxID=54254 RepID=A0A7C2BJN7_9CREN
MKTISKILRVSTRDRFQLINITMEVESFVRESGICRGILVISVPHATASIIVNENEPGLLSDIIEKVKEITEPDSSKWLHNSIDDNAHAHIGSALFGHERVFPVNECRIFKGIWQDIFLLEMDGPRSERKIVLTILGE